MKSTLASNTALPAGAPRARAGAAAGTLLLSRSDVERLLTPDECISAVEDAFRQHALGKAPAPGILGLHAEDRSFHIKAAPLTLGEPPKVWMSSFQGNRRRVIGIRNVSST
jgi:ornithine cyclodeaminase/alanine dehydrogenase-like protein (mu-crystallin family)